MLAGVLSSVALVVLLWKLGCLVSKRRNVARPSADQPNEQIKIVIEQPQTNSSKKTMTQDSETTDKPDTSMINDELYAEHEYQEVSNSDPKVMNFSSRPNRSQFAKK